jgi:hypothetical protein
MAKSQTGTPEYYYFWIPSTSHAPVEKLPVKETRRKFFSKCCRIDDEKSNQLDVIHILVATINIDDLSNKDILLTSIRPIAQEGDQKQLLKKLKSDYLNKLNIDGFLKTDESAEIASLRLRYDAESRNGLFKYHYIIDEETSKDVDYITEALNASAYDLIKSFFHEHEFHEDADAHIKAILERKDIDLKASDNEVLRHFLEDFERKFKINARRIAETMDLLVNTEITDSKGKKTTDFDGLRDNLTIILSEAHDLCKKSLGEIIYYQSLYYSCYNVSGRYDHKSKNDDEKELHRIALNTKNHIDRIRRLHDVCIEEISRQSAMYTAKAGPWLQIQSIKTGQLTKASVLLCIISLALGALSLCLALKQSANEKIKDPNNAAYEILNDTNSDGV